MSKPNKHDRKCYFCNNRAIYAPQWTNQLRLKPVYCFSCMIAHNSGEIVIAKDYDSCQEIKPIFARIKGPKLLLVANRKALQLQQLELSLQNQQLKLADSLAKV